MSDKLRAAALMAVDALDSDDPTIQTRAALSLRAALAEPEQITHPFEDAAVIAALYWASILIEKQYPVGHNGADSWLMNYSDKHGENVRRYDHREWEKVNGRWKIKAAPPRREWVGLTDEEIEQGCKESWVTEQAWQSVVWWAEARLKEKNGG
jgi:hypothetical protein